MCDQMVVKNLIKYKTGRGMWIKIDPLRRDCSSVKEPRDAIPDLLSSLT